MSIEIKILHSSCCGANSPIKNQIENLASKNNLEVSIVELSDIQDTAQFGTMSFPSLVVNGEIYDYKKLSSDKEIVSILNS